MCLSSFNRIFSNKRRITIWYVFSSCIIMLSSVVVAMAAVLVVAVMAMAIAECMLYEMNDKTRMKISERKYHSSHFINAHSNEWTNVLCGRTLLRAAIHEWHERTGWTSGQQQDQQQREWGSDGMTLHKNASKHHIHVCVSLEFTGLNLDHLSNAAFFYSILYNSAFLSGVSLWNVDVDIDNWIHASCMCAMLVRRDCGELTYTNTIYSIHSTMDLLGRCTRSSEWMLFCNWKRARASCLVVVAGCFVVVVCIRSLLSARFRFALISTLARHSPMNTNTEFTIAFGSVVVWPTMDDACLNIYVDG